MVNYLSSQHMRWRGQGCPVLYVQGLRDAWERQVPPQHDLYPESPMTLVTSKLPSVNSRVKKFGLWFADRIFTFGLV